MPQVVRENKTKTLREFAIANTILLLIPVLIISFTGFKSFNTPYGIYSLAMLGIGLYFSWIIGIVSRKHIVIYIILDTINFISSIGFVIYAYINSSYQGGLLLHIAAALFLTYAIYKIGDSFQGDNYFFRFSLPLTLDIAGLIFILWFINVKMSVTAHIVIVSIINFISLAFFIPSLVVMLKNYKKFFAKICSKELVYETETDAEKIERKAKKLEKAEAKKQLAANKNKTTVTQRQDSISNSVKWSPFVDSLNRLMRDFVNQYNQCVRSLNMDIDTNNSIIDGYESLKEKEAAIKRNKDIKSGIKYLNKKLQNLKDNLKKISTRTFTAEDKYKSFDFYLRKGKMKVTSSNDERPSLHLHSFRIYYKYYYRFDNKNLYEIKCSGEDIYLKKISE